MTDYHREPGPWNRFASSPTGSPSSSNSTTISPNSRRAPRTAPTTQSGIRCSDCGAMLSMMELGEHHCGGVPIEKIKKPEMRVDTGLRAGVGGSQLSARGYLDSDFLPPRSASLDTSPSLARQSLPSPSFTSAGAAPSGNKLPFFERYQKLVGTVSSGLNETITRSKSTLDDLTKLTIGEPTSKSTPSPTFASRSIPSPSSPPRQPVHHRQESSTELLYTKENRSASPTSSSSDSASVGNYFSTRRPTPTSSSHSQPPRSRKASLVTPTPDRPTFARNASDSVVAGGMKGSKSTPADLASHGALRSPISPTSSWKGLPIDTTAMSRNGKGLDDILNDLNFMMTDDAELSPQFSLDVDEVEERTTSKIPHSHSSPAISDSTRTTKCATCRSTLVDSTGTKRAADGEVVCAGCSRAVECRKCRKVIKGASITSEKITGKYHPSCFSCSACPTKLKSEFYVFEARPYCQQHYHRLNGSLCTNRSCGGPIEGPCVSLVGKANGDGGRYHPECFKCATCQTPLLEYHFVISRLPYCERHADLDLPPRSFLPSNPTPSSRLPLRKDDGGLRAKKRQTLISRS